MPETDLHRRRRAKNYAMLAALVTFVAIVFAVTILKMMPS